MKKQTILVILLLLVAIILGRSLGKTMTKRQPATSAPVILPTETKPPTETMVTTLIENAPEESTSWPTPMPSASEVSMWSSGSPDGEWVARGIFSIPKNGEQAGQTYARVSVGRPNGRIYWTLFEGWLAGGLGFTTPQPVKWSADSRYFYYTEQPAVEGCKVLHANGVDLHRLDIVTGEIVELLPDSAFSIALSPDDKRLAYIAQGSLHLIIRDLTSGVEQLVEIDPGWEYDAGNLYWSADGNQLALTLANRPCTGQYQETGLFAESTSILVVDTEDYKVRKVIDQDATYKITIGWDIEGNIMLQDGAGAMYILDEETGFLKTVN